MPSDADLRTNLPLVVAFHGSGAGDGVAMMALLDEVSGLTAAADRNGFLLVFAIGAGTQTTWGYPGRPASSTSEADDLAYADALLSTVEDTYCVDQDHVSAVGLSDGGGLVARWACSSAHRLSAVAVVSGIYMDEPCRADQPVAVIAFHGVDDPFVPFAGGPLPGDDGTVLPVEQWARGWADRNGCDQAGQPSTEPGSRTWVWDQATSSGDGAAERCAAPVELLAVDGLGHMWPGPAALPPSAVDATALMMRFFGASSRADHVIAASALPAIRSQLMAAWSTDQLASLAGAPGGALFHHDPSGWAVEDISFGDGRWCRRATYGWVIEEVTNWSHFVVTYTVVDEPDECLPSGWSHLQLVVDAVGRTADGRREFVGAYRDVLPGVATRIACDVVGCATDTGLPPPEPS